MPIELGGGARAALAAFAHPPLDARTVCIVVLDGPSRPETAIACRDTGAPVVLTCDRGELQWWKMGPTDARPIGNPIHAEHAAAFFEKHSGDFAPRNVYRAKTWARFDKQLRLPFVDVDLMPVVERDAGKALKELIESGYDRLGQELGWTDPDATQGRWMLQSVFWLVSAKMLRDKGVPTFSDLDLHDVRDALGRVAQHHSAQPAKVGPQQAAALADVASAITDYPSLRFVTTEALAFVYENAMITKAVRDQLGTHSTPTYLVDYVVGRLASWIEQQIDPSRRNVFEPACGHAAFLGAAMRLLTELLPEEKSAASNRRTYLRSRIHGCEMDSFALEIARLSLTLADIPNPDGWDLAPGDMFKTDLLERKSRSATILLANPPFMNFSAEERDEYRSAGFECLYRNKTAEMLRRTLPHLPGGSCFGVVVPQGFLHSEDAADLRREVLDEFELDEILLFPDKVFAFSDIESAVLIGRKPSPRNAVHQVRYRRVRERTINEFREYYQGATERTIPQSRFLTHECDLRVPELEQVWASVQSLPHRLCDIADVGRGFSPTSEKLRKGARFYFDKKAKGRIPVYHIFPDGIGLHEVPKEEWADLSTENIDRGRWGLTRGAPQVLFNYLRTSRGPWRLKALIDQQGHAVSASFVVVRPKRDNLPLEFLWALLNSPIANAYAFSHLAKRHNIEGTMRHLRIPDATPPQLAKITELVREYMASAEASEHPLFEKRKPNTPEERLLRIDTAVLDLYGLSATLERELLDYFNDWPRLGVPFRFDRYFPKHFERPVRFRDVIAVIYDWPKTNRRRGRLITRDVDGTITGPEADELRRLQALADLRTDLLDPFELQELEQLRAEIAIGANG